MFFFQQLSITEYLFSACNVPKQRALQVETQRAERAHPDNWETEVTHSFCKRENVYVWMLNWVSHVVKPKSLKILANARLPPLHTQNPPGRARAQTSKASAWTRCRGPLQGHFLPLTSVTFISGGRARGQPQVTDGRRYTALRKVPICYVRESPL